MKTFYRTIRLLMLPALLWTFSGKVSAQVINDPIVVALYDSTQSGTNYLCSQPWDYFAMINANGNNGGTNVDSVHFMIDWGDGQTQSVFALATNQTNYYWSYFNTTHIYAATGVYSITIIGTSWSGGTPQNSDTLSMPGHLVVSDCDLLEGYIYLDVDGSCTNNAGDYPAPYSQVIITDASNNPVTCVYTNSMGYYSVPLPTGQSYTVTAGWPFSSSAFSCSSGPSHSFTLSGTHTHDFSLQYTAGAFDLNISYLNAIMSINGGRSVQFNITELMNPSPQPANVTLTLPPGVTPSYSSHAYTLAGNVMTYNPVVINPFNSPSGTGWWNAYFWNGFVFDSSIVHMGDTLCFTVHVDPTSGDVNPANNTDQICVIVLNSYDPNNKLVSPAGFGPAGNIPPGQTTMKYTVNFQNTGNAAAYNIDIVDTLDADLDLSTFNLDYTSHPCQLIANGNVMTFRFNNINLPDSNSNEPGSHGFVQYSINVPASAPLGTQFSNTAYIYFDYNPPIITNTTVNTIALVSIEGNDGEVYSISFFPNPATDIVNIRLDKPIDGTILLTDMNGKVLLQQNMAAQQLTQVNVSGISDGMYILEVRTGQFSEKHKLVIR